MARTIATVNPATGEVLKVYSSTSTAELNTKLALAQATFLTYRRTSFVQRAQWLEQAAQILELRRTDYAAMMTKAMGKPLAQALAEVDKCIVGCRFYAERAQGYLAPVAGELPGTSIHFDPLGVILAVMPWNFPFWQVFRFAAPALMAGNVGLLKHASNVPECALAIEEIFVEAGFPLGCFQTLLVGGAQVAELVADPRIKAATLTGSEPAGQSLAAACGHHLKKVVLELGGSDPFIVLPSADLDRAVQTAVIGRTQNNGQSCIAAKRFILVGEIASAFTDKLVAAFESLRMGDPMEATTQIGPLATPEIREQLHQQVLDSVAKGAKILTGGYIPEGAGNFYPPTILTEIAVDSPAYYEELFGPVAAIFCVADLDAALALANGTNFGLGASGWTTDPAEKTRLIHELEAGSVFINGLVRSDPRLPFGGIKNSGYGRELGKYGIQEFVNIKTVWVE